MKDVVTSYWFNYKMATIDMGDKPFEQAKEHILKTGVLILFMFEKRLRAFQQELLAR